MAYLNPDVIRNLVVLDQAANEHEVRVAGSRVGYLDLLDAGFYQLSEEGCFLFDCHGVSKGLVSVSEIGGQPYGSFGESFRRPLTVGEMNGSVGLIFIRRVDTMKASQRSAQGKSKVKQTASACWQK